MAEVKCYNCGSLFEEDASKKDIYPKNCSNCSEEDALKKAQKDSESMGIKFDLKPEKSTRKEWVMNKNQSDKNKFVKVIDFDMEFTSMVKFMVKWVIASIPAFIILFFIYLIFNIFLFGMLTNL